jgi:hypothetical protein
MIRIDSEEDGFWITVEDDEDTGHEIGFGQDDSHVIGYRMRIDDPEALYKAVKDVIAPWIDERNDAKAEFEASQRYGYNPDEDSGYALTDPKHPTFHDRMAGFSDDR